MAMKKGGLGKGLDVLFAENAIEEEGKTVSLPLSEIEPNRGQPRKQFDEEALAELAASIAQHGVLQPLLVRPIAGGSYQLVAGERRWRASRLAGLTEVPVVIREMNDQQAAELALIENLQREDLNPMEEAMGYQTLMESYGMTQEETAQAVNKSRPAVANALRLLHLPDTVRRMVSEGELSAGHAVRSSPLTRRRSSSTRRQPPLTAASRCGSWSGWPKAQSGEGAQKAQGTRNRLFPPLLFRGGGAVPDRAYGAAGQGGAGRQERDAAN